MKGNLGLEAVALRRCEPLIRRWPDGPTAPGPIPFAWLCRLWRMQNSWKRRN